MTPSAMTPSAPGPEVVMMVVPACRIVHGPIIAPYGRNWLSGTTLTTTLTPTLIRPAAIRGAAGIFPMCAGGPRRQAEAMNTTTENPEDLTTESDPRTGPSTDPRTGSPFGYQPEHAALRRPFNDRMLAGVAAGVARYFGVDVTIVRIAFALLTVMGGAGIPLYLAGLLLIPEEGSDVSIASSLVESLQSRSRS
jgi:phage shock protein PspC (stress-responsive transcriptional regulator)